MTRSSKVFFNMIPQSYEGWQKSILTSAFLACPRQQARAEGTWVGELNLEYWVVPRGPWLATIQQVAWPIWVTGDLD